MSGDYPDLRLAVTMALIEMTQYLPKASAVILVSMKILYSVRAF